ncbi:MAG: DHHA1 domain-containing protein [Anaerolineae bacterium]|jgi:alanyl-tRNA synthetase
MTKRLYYGEPYRTHFTAQVVEQLTWDDHPAVVLDRTAFYPTSGGQPADRGSLDGTEVLAVVEREADGAIVHVLSGAITGAEIQGEVNWRRRFDHMQQHTGQHILSAAFQQELDASTVGFHLGEVDHEERKHKTESSTIDVDIAQLDMGAVLSVERLANLVVWEDRPVTVRFVDADELTELSIKHPADVKGPIRLAEIARPSGGAGPPFDLNPCGGTHVARTGEIGMIKIIGLEHRSDKTRIEFLCGARALRDYEAKNGITATLASKLTVGYWELEDAIDRLQEENKELQHTQRELRQRLLDMEATQLLGTAVVPGPYQVVAKVWQQRRPDELRILARKLAEHSDVVALLFTVNERTHFCFARAENLDLDVNELLQEACNRLDGKGGGRPQVAQGSAPATELDDVQAVLSDLQLRALEL